MRNSCFVLALRYCSRSKLVFTSFCFQNVPKPELTSVAWIMDPNSQKWSQKGYHSLPFAAKFSVWRSLIFEQSHSLNNWQGSFPHHSILPCNWTCHFLYKVKVFWQLEEKRLLIALFVLPFGTWRYQVFIRYHWASASMTKGNRLSKRKRNVLRRDDGSIFIIIPSKYALLTKREVNMTGYLGKFPFCILCTETKSRPIKNENDANIQLSWPKKVGQ